MIVPMGNQEMPLSISSFQPTVSVPNENKIIVVNCTHKAASKEDPDSSKVFIQYNKHFQTFLVL